MIPVQERTAVNGMVSSVDHLASEAGVAMLRAGGSAADAAVATSAVLAVTSQHLCGMGGDLFAVVHDPADPSAIPQVVNASGRAGSGASQAADVLRAAGATTMPFKDDIRSVTIPGCVDGWLSLHQRYGRLPLADVMAPAVGYAHDGFAPGHLARMVRPFMAELRDGDDYRGDDAVVRRPGVAAALEAIVADGRAAFYEGAFGEGLIALGDGLYTRDDLAADQADWAPAIGVTAFGHQLWGAAPNSQAYAALAAAWIANGLDLPDDPDDPLWAHLLIEASRQAAYDRPEVLHDAADGAALVAEERLGPRRAAIDGVAASDLADAYRTGGTMCMTAVDRDRMAVTLIQSNASGWGSNLVEPSTRIFLHNRGMGFSLDPASPATLAPGRRPPHTLSPMMVTDVDGDLRMAIGTMGGDSQPQILLQLLARTLVHGASPAHAVADGRFVLASAKKGGTGFDTWAERGKVRVRVEANAAPGWADGLEERGHTVDRSPAFDHGFGHAHVIALDGEVLVGGADPRSRSGGAAGY